MRGRQTLNFSLLKSIIIFIIFSTELRYGFDGSEVIVHTIIELRNRNPIAIAIRWFLATGPSFFSFLFIGRLTVNSFEIGGSSSSSIVFVFLHWFLQRWCTEEEKIQEKKRNELGLLGFELGSLYLQNCHSVEKIDKYGLHFA